MTNQNNNGLPSYVPSYDGGKPEEQAYDVVIVGAGAAGIGCGVVLQDLGVERFTIIDRHDVGASFRRWPKETRLLTPSFTINGFGMMDLNAIALQTSPAFTLNTEHPTGSEYALYLHAIAEYFQLPIQTGINVDDVEPYSDQTGFKISTNQGDIHTRFVIWAAGEFQYPDQHTFPGADLCRHYATVASWEEWEGDDAVVIGGYESGIDTAIHLARNGKRVIVLDPDAPWESTEADPSLSLSPFTLDRLRRANQNDEISFLPVAVMKVEEIDDEYYLYLSNGKTAKTSRPPILATGFIGSHMLISHLFKWNPETGSPIVTEEADESTLTPGLFLSGPMLRHRKVIFCFIYKFRQRFAIIGNAIADELGLDLDTAVLEKYRQGEMYLDDLDCCAVECAC